MNKNEYKEAVNKIVISDESREKIIQNLQKKKIHKSHISKKKSIYKHFQKAAGIAACFAICVISYYAVTKYYRFPDDMPAGTAKPIVEIPNVSDSPTVNDDFVFVTPGTDDIRNDTRNPGKSSMHENITEPKTKSSDSSIDTDKYATELPELGDNENSQPTPSDTDDTSETVVESNGYTNENIFAISDIENVLGYKIKIPNYVPENYKIDSLSAPFVEFAEITYTDDTDKLYYRTAKGSEDISGDYNTYDDVETMVINGNSVTIKGNDNLYNNASWLSEDEVFSIYSNNGIEKDILINIVKSVK